MIKIKRVCVPSTPRIGTLPEHLYSRVTPINQIVVQSVPVFQVFHPILVITENYLELILKTSFS